MPIREECMDLFGYISGQKYYKDKAFAASAITGNSIDLGADHPAIVDEYRVTIKLTETGAGGTSVVAKIQDSADGSTWADLIVGDTVLLADMSKDKDLLTARLPQTCRRYVRGMITPSGTFTAGKAYGNIEVLPS